ncbi:MAG: DSBA oxidoreductase [Candidatus Collierbacteria bacterium GW2011_GWD2_45_10]|uniref:DSBA oxidoreductase n=1 Tax=Candidatus Collierbacteria bacterium GW2011_GWB2_44_22 TaxID=1618387 RepID=A0A0G1KU29_9BACT|nr:MAG: DSBA oxidoreductase [Candidatus Collierbacteria bacterium GW2011_GWB2_44_22]KKT88372.1 MAG: DSBA oxidoreductase [Candidatus Collierbacteria bacterium GW2011_GWD2_45_10]
MNDWKLILKVTIGCAALLLVAIWGLSKMAGPENALKVEESVLLAGARFVKENGETKVTVVNFSDMQCPSCKAADIQTKELFNMPGVKIVTRLFPLPSSLHRYALISAKAAEAARVLGKGFEMVAVLYDKQEEWSAVSKPEDNFADYAKSLGLDEKTFREKLASNEVAQNVQADANLATSLQLSGTPTFFVNGEQVGAPFVVDKVKQLLGEK